MRYFLLALSGIFIVPLSSLIQLPGTDVWYVQYLALLCLALFGINLWVWDFNKYLSVFLGLCLYSAVVTANQNPRSMIILFHVYLMALAGIKMSQLNPKQRWWVLRALVVMSIINGVMCFVQFLNLDPFFKFVRPEEKLCDTVGFSGSHNQIGLYFADTIVPTLSVVPWLAPLIIFGLFVSTTSSAMAGAVAGMTLYFWFINKKFLLAYFFIIPFLLLFFLAKFERIDSVVMNERARLYKVTIEQSLKGEAVMRRGDMVTLVQWNPWFGAGIGNFMRISPHAQDKVVLTKPKSPERPTHRYEHVHNDILEILFEMGKSGFVVALLIILDLIYRFIVSRKTKLSIICFCGIIAHLATSQGVYTVHTAVSGMLLVILWALLEGELKDGKSPGMV